MAKKIDDRASRPDEDNPEWTAEDFARARAASEVLPGLIGQKATDELGGRPSLTARSIRRCGWTPTWWRPTAGKVPDGRRT